MSYIDGFVIAVPTANKQTFIDHANMADSMFIDMGATRVIECWGDDISEGKTTDFRKAVKATADESIVFSWIEWPDKATRDAGMAKLEADDFRWIRTGGRSPINGKPPDHLHRRENPPDRMLSGGLCYQTLVQPTEKGAST